MKDWDDLVAHALVGTDRSTVGGAPRTSAGAATSLLDEMIAAAGAGDRGDDPTRPLLDRAALLTIFRRAGTQARPAIAEPLSPAQAEPDTAAPCPSPAAQRLRRLLDGAETDLLPEWCDRVAARGERMPDAELPLALERGRHNVALRSHLAPVIGRRGRWLAGCNDRWRWATGVDEAAPVDVLRSTFETGRANEREDALRRWRATDADAARDALVATWPTENAADRTSFVEALAVALSDRDEPFLESALDDRSKIVRAAAATLLADLPASRLSARMAARALAAVQRSRKELVISLPAELTDDMARDGIVEKPPRNIGVRAWWLRQIVAATPLTTWSALGDPPAKLVHLSVTEGWQAQLHEAWIEAATRQRDVAWAEALAHVLPLEAAAPLLPVLAPEAREQVVLQHVKRVGIDAAATSGMSTLPAPWSPSASRSLVDAAAALARQRTRTELAPKDAARLFTAFNHTAAILPRQLDPATLPHAIDRFRAVLDELVDDLPLRRMIDTLQFRYEMLQELT